jgi:hypothetical protein
MSNDLKDINDHNDLIKLVIKVFIAVKVVFSVGMTTFSFLAGLWVEEKRAVVRLRKI